MKNLATSYMGIQLKNPIILGASEMSSEIDSLKKAEQAGAAAIVYKTLFEEQIQLEDLQFDELKEEYNDIHAEMTSLHPDVDRTGHAVSEPAERLMFAMAPVGLQMRLRRRAA